MERKIYCIYCIENLANGKKYVGQTKDYKKRISQHLYKLRKGNEESLLLRRAWEKYGEENFKIYILSECDLSKDCKILDKLEIFYIKYLHTHYSENGYNISWGGNAPMGGRTHTDEIKEKMRISHLGKKKTKEEAEEISRRQKNIPKSQETKDKISKTVKSQTSSIEWKNRMESRATDEYGEMMTKSIQGSKRKDKDCVGVYFYGKRQKWGAQIGFKKKHYYLGYYDTKEEAMLAYNNKALELYGDDANLNIISDEKHNMISSIKYFEYKIGKASKYHGVYKKKNRWVMSIRYKGQNLRFSFCTELEAALAYNKASLEFYGYKAKINKIAEEEIQQLWES